MSKIAVDYDDVLIPFMQRFLDWHNEGFNTNMHAHNLIDFTSFSQSFGQTNQYWADRMNEYHSSGLSASHDPHDSAIEVLKELRVNHEIVILTSRPSTHRLHLEAWISRHAPDVFSELHMFEGDQKRPTVGHEKGQTCNEIGAAYLIDDNPFYVESAKRHGVTGILFGEHNWNKDHRLEHLHASDWRAVQGIING